MLDQLTITQLYSVLAVLVCGGLLSLGAIAFRARRFANAVSHGAGLVAGVLGAVCSAGVLLSGTVLSASNASPFPFLAYSFRIDGLSAWFMLIISIGAIAASIYGYGYVLRERAIRPEVFGFFYTVFIASLYTVVAADNGIFFLIAWEIMSLTSYFLIVHEHHEATNVRAGLIYLLMTQVGTAFLTFAILLAGWHAGSLDFAAWRDLESWPSLVRHTVLAAALAGLGLKAGIVPLHVWLPEAHPAAPSHVSALLSGVMLKVAIFMIVRFFFDLLGLPAELWWGVVILALGACSALLGVLYALSEHDLKRLLAYHSVENIGIILLGVGCAAVAAGAGNDMLALAALAAALFHSLNHAVFKGLLFMGAGSVVQTTHTRNMERYGGLIRILPATTFLFLLGSLAISGLPPLNGFASEWLTFQALLAGAATSTLYLKALFVAAIGFLAITSGLAAACFVKAVGTTFLARPRANVPKTSEKREPASMVVGMGALALLTVLLGIYASRVIETIMRGVAGFFGDESSIVFVREGHAIMTERVSMIPFSELFLVLVLFVSVAYLAVHAIASRKETIGRVWACGAPMERSAFAGGEERAEITSTAFARTLMVVFRRMVPTVERSERTVSEHGVLRESLEVHAVDVWRTYLYAPIERVAAFCARMVRFLQSGNVNLYLLYMLGTLSALFLFAL